jgi:hypothetical protein
MLRYNNNTLVVVCARQKSILNLALRSSASSSDGTRRSQSAAAAGSTRKRTQVGYWVCLAHTRRRAGDSTSVAEHDFLSIKAIFALARFGSNTSNTHSRSLAQKLEHVGGRNFN